MKASPSGIAFVLPVLLSACVSTPPISSHEPQPSFYDSRLQYALVSDDRQALKQDFGMKAPTGVSERIVAGAMLPFTVAVDTLFWPASTAIRELTSDPPSDDRIRKKP